MKRHHSDDQPRAPKTGKFERKTNARGFHSPQEGLAGWAGAAPVPEPVNGPRRPFRVAPGQTPAGSVPGSDGDA